MSTSTRENITHSPSWAMENLVGNANLRLGIPDTILFRDGAPHVWLFTSKTGDVLNKRSLRKSSIKERFTRLFATNPNNPHQRIATVRFMDGTVRNLGREAFKEMMSKFPATEPGIVSIQCYMQGKGASGTVYRNSYRVVNDKGLAVTGTSSFTTLAADQTAATPSCTWSEREIKLEKCLASSINKALDAVTLGIVRYIEAEQDKPTRILGLMCDYVVDAASQIWLTWMGETTTAVADAARDLRLANVAMEGPRGRGEFLGPQNALDMQREFGGPPGPTRKARRRVDCPPAGAASTGEEADLGEAVDRAAEVIELPCEKFGAGGSGGIANVLSRAKAAKHGAMVSLPGAGTSSSVVAGSSSSPSLAGMREQNVDATMRATTLSTMTVGVKTGEAWEAKGSGGRSLGEKRFPSSFACAGDYCTIRVLDPREDADDPRKKRDPQGSLLDPAISDKDFFTEVATRLFSGQELSALRRDASFRRQIEEGLVMEVKTPSSTTAGAGGGEGGQHAGGGASAPGRHCGAGGGPKGDPVAGGLKDRDPTAWSEVSWKSISLARRGRENRAGSAKEDKEGLSLLDSGETQNKFGTVGKGGVGEGADGSSGSGEGQKDTRRRSLQETESSTMRQHARKREDEFLAGGAQNFYKPVRVCGSCFRVYALLDKARAAIARQEALTAEELAVCERSDFLDSSRSSVPRRRRPRAKQHDLYSAQEEGTDPVSVSSDELQERRRRRRGGGGGSDSTRSTAAGALPTRPRSHGDDDGQAKKQRRHRADGSGGFSGGGWEAHTWRGRLEEGNGAGQNKGKGLANRPALSSGKKFEDLDNYLRGCASASAAKREKRKRGLGLSRGSGGGESCAGTTTDGSSLSFAEGHEDDDGEEEGSGLFHARVLVAEAEPRSAKTIKETLEQAGYMVTVEGDGKQVLEALIDGDGEWDALVVERDTPVMDGFQIASALRDFEKARRNRSSMVRAAAVEGHAKAGGGGTTTHGQGRQQDDGAPSSVPPAAELRHLPIICLTSKASPDDLRSYMAAGMDGCISKPAEPGPLLNTLRAAIPRHLSRPSSINGGALTNGAGPGRGGGMKVMQGKGMGVLKGSAACAAEGMALAPRHEGSVEGSLQVDADTAVPYCVVGSPPSAGGSSGRFFNLVVCHDLFDNYERMKIVVAPLIARYPGAQVLLWNYPGQAFSEWREQQLLNNEYLSTILQFLLLHLGKKSKGGTGDFDSDRPYHLVGFGSGGAVATFYASHFATPSPRSLLLINSFSYVDAYLAGVLHDCMNVFNCAPESRPDLPVYFHARFLFSPAYLGQVSTPLALNIYTAVHNPISVKGRLQLCKGALAHVDTRPVLSEIDIPVVCIQSTQNNFVKPLHTDPYVSRRGGEVRSIHKALQDPSKTCVVWMNAGHELFQEARIQTTTLLEQAISGYHEGNDVVYAMSHPEFAATNATAGGNKPGSAGRAGGVGAGGHGGGLDEARASKSRRSTATRGSAAAAIGGGASGNGIGGGDTFEDSFIDNVLGTMSDMQSEARHRERGNLLRAGRGAGAGGDGSASTLDAHGRGGEEEDTTADNTEMGSAWDGSLGEVYGSSWEKYRSSVAVAGTNAANRGGHFGNTGGAGSASDEEERWRRDRRGKGRRRRGGGKPGGEGNGRVQGRNIMVGTVLDAAHPAFERQDNLVYGFGQGSKVYPQPEEFPEVKEYMSWRLKRNRKRLVRLDRAARKIQGALRAYLALKRAQLMRENRACVYIQTIFRGWRGRLMFLEKLRSVWAAQVVQRNWRGYASRRWFRLLRRQQAACGHMQRVWRGALIRRLVKATRRRRDHAAAVIQSLWRGVSGRRYAFRCREEKYNAMTIQRVFRGHTGRRRAGRERDKYLFSKSQSQGIDFGRQMLLEHKLHATRLQSDVQLLTGEKVGAEEAVEAMMEEISEFEEAVTVLEREMHQLSKIETEAVGVLDEEARLELREQKARLDKEFGEMLGKIADRKDRLLHMEKKLATLDRTRLGKEEELRTLERKLVVLLEEQQRELDNIRRRQEKKGVLLLTASGDGSGGGPGDMLSGGGDGAGPSAKDKRQAAQLMQSTETLMKFGFMSMSMTYFSSLNMIRAMRSVGATDTVMAALAHNANGAGGGGAGSGGGDGGGGRDDGRALALEQNEKLGAESFRPALKPGQLPGQEPLAVSAWSVDDVARWLQTLTLTQYQEAFIAAAVDGAFLYDLNDDDLKSSLGVEHRLHRKKILNSIGRLKAAEAERVRPVALNSAMSSQKGMQGSPEGFHQQSFDQGFDPVILGDAGEALGRVGTADGGGSPGASGGGIGPVSVPIQFKELLVLTRRGKYKQIREILEPLPDRRFDTSTIRVPYVTGFGTAYVDAYEQEPFNLNKTDDHGNTLLIVAAQNGNIKMAKLYVYKGANPNHQNKAGQSAGHYAVSYQFFEMSEWLFLQDGNGGGADDTLENSFGLGPYDGLQPDGGGGGGELMLEGGG
ncbi:Response receiver [Ectocarpus siliculosus]|uniref:Response receiver n=1 Tax=Ectocarpus siliculosus TaxID=2880 RepID=D8LLW6_ECTSI|nr:Response receiver [Ectocarpus siliculosus]|eukprot:CBN77180.1 Response receiver [Ectocarpus siliculosus]